jgi:hypothetical protein
VIVRRFRRFQAEQSGQIAFLTLFGAVALIGLLGMVMTTGDQASLKVEAQNAADAAALSGGAWIARGLNLTSAINVAQTQLVGGAIVLQALRRVLIMAPEYLAGEAALYTACLPFCAIPLGIVNGQISLLTEIWTGLFNVIDSLSSCSSGAFWIATRLLGVLNTAIHTTFFAIAFAEMLSIARDDGAEFAVFLPGPLFHGTFGGLLTLPTEQAEFPALCDSMEHGSPTPDQRGYTKLLHYPVGQGPLALGKCRLSLASALITGLPPFGPVLLPIFANQLRNQLCGSGSTGSVRAEIEKPVESLAECRRLHGTAHWAVTKVETKIPVSESNGCSWFASQRGTTPPPFQGIPNVKEWPQSPVDLSCNESPSGERIDDRTNCAVDLRQEETGSSPVRYFHTLTISTLERASVRSPVDVEPPPSQAGGCGELPKPYLLRSENDALKFLVVTRRVNRRVFFASEKFLEEPPAIYAYSQVEVYSGISADTFNQDWWVRLERAYLLEIPFKQLGENLSGFFADLDRFANLLPVVLPHDSLAPLSPDLLRALFSSQAKGDTPADDEDGETSLRRVLNH